MPSSFIMSSYQPALTKEDDYQLSSVVIPRAVAPQQIHQQQLEQPQEDILMEMTEEEGT
jgi:hypothetical protein